MTTWRVEYMQRWDIASDDILEAYPQEWEHAQGRGKTEDDFIKETLRMLGDDQLEDFASSEQDWDIEKR